MKTGTSKETIGFIGLGVMGTPIASNLLSAGYTVRMFSRSGIPDALCHAGGNQCESVADVATGCSVIFLMLPDSPNVEEVLFGQGGLSRVLRPGQTIVDLSSISPEATREFAEKIRQLQCDYLDAPVSGGEIGAQQATLSIMVGGDQRTFVSVLPMLETIGQNITRIGESGTGQIAKLANQIIVALNIEAVAEGLVFAKKAGADPSAVRSALTGGFASSRALELHGNRMISRSFDPGFRIALHQKDLGLALGTAQKIGVALPNVAMAQQLFSVAAATAGADQDHSAIVVAIENLANEKLG